MQYRHINKANVDVSSFGLGCMRLPTLPDGKIDEPAAIAMIRRAIDGGVNYIDTAYGYHDHESERLVGKALQDGYREKVFLVTKCPVWLAKSREDYYRLLDEQLEKLQTDHVDFYLMHALDGARFDEMKEFGYKEFIEDVKAQGKIRFPAFSFHGDLADFKRIVDDYDGWVEAQIQFNYIDTEIQAGLEGLKYAAARDIGIVVMEPLKGGSLVNLLPKPVEELLQKANSSYSKVEWAMRWLYSFPEIKVILSGCSTMEQVEDHLRIQQNSDLTLTEEQKAVMAEARKLYFESFEIGCTGCRYCQPCPQGVHIPEIFAMYNRARMYDERENTAKRYQELQEKQQDASRCVECGFCSSQCPQHFDIPALLKKVDEYYTKGE